MQRLGDYIDQIRGVSYKPVDVRDENSGIAILRANNIQDKVDLSDLVYVDENKVSDVQFLKKGDVLICASSGSKNLVGKAVLIPNDMNASFGAFCKVVRIKQISEVNSDFIRMFFLSKNYRNAIAECSIGANINNIKSDHLNGLGINIPNYDIQCSAVDYLTKLKQAIDLKRKQLEDLDELVKSKFQEMFGDESKFDKQPLSKSVVEMFIGPFGSALKNECFVDREQGHCIVYEQKHAIKKTVDLPVRYITEKKYNELRRFTVLPDDIIISCRGTIGEVYTIPQGAPLGVIHPSLMKIRLKSGVYNNVFFTYIIEKYMQEHAYKAVGNCVKMAVTATVLGKESFIVPSKKMQDDFAQYDKGVRKAKEIVQHEIDDLEELMDSKMDEYFG
jgi:type I restriction enzyme S subunit